MIYNMVKEAYAKEGERKFYLFGKRTRRSRMKRTRRAKRRCVRV